MPTMKDLCDQWNASPAAVEECAACGKPSCPNPITGAALFVEEHALCGRCWDGTNGSSKSILSDIAARRSAPTPAATESECVRCEARPGLLNDDGLCNECVIRSPAKAVEPDPYRRSGLNDEETLHVERELAAHVQREDEMPRALHGPSRRDKLLAALAKDLDRSTEERRRGMGFPPEGRSCRVYKENER